MSDDRTDLGDVHLNPAPFEAFMARKHEGPVQMLNLLKFKPDGGMESYLQYSVATQPLIEKTGGRVVYVGRPVELLIGDEEWDLMVLVEYPTRQAFLDMVTSADYQRTAHMRHQALLRSVLYATDPIQV